MINKFSVEGNIVEMAVADQQILFDLDDFPKMDNFNQWKISRSKSIVADYRDKSAGGVVGQMHRVVLHKLLSGHKFVRWLNGNIYDFRKTNMVQAKQSCNHTPGEKTRDGNQYRVDNDTIVLFMENKGIKYEGLIDTEDYLFMREYTWNRNPKSGYLQSCSREGRVKTKSVYLHRLLMGVTEFATKVDHINGNKMDNRKSNLRVCTNSQNHHNTTKNRNGSVVGVSRVIRSYWEARIQIDKVRRLKRFKTYEKALDQRRAWEQEFNPSGLSDEQKATR